MEQSWYVVKVMPGKERKLNEQFNKEISSGKIDNILRFVCPTEQNIVVVKNKKIAKEKVIYSGYLYFETKRKLNEKELKKISGIEGLMGLMGDKTPILVRDNDVRKILKDDMLENHIESKRLRFSVGDNITVLEGPFQSFTGIISEIKGDKVDIEVKIFGRNTSVSLTLSQIEKTQ
jgi:transcriptional antiterminator NusG